MVTFSPSPCAFYQPAMHKTHSRLVLGLLSAFHVCWFVCASALITCTVITSCTLLPCNFTLVNLMAALSAGVATKSSLAQLQVWDTAEQRQQKCDNIRLIKSGHARSEQLFMMPTELLTDWEWLLGEPLSGSDCLNAQLVFYLLVCLFVCLFVCLPACMFSGM